MKIVNDPALIAANKVYRRRSLRYGLIAGVFDAAVAIGIGIAGICLGLFVLFIRNQ